MAVVQITGSNGKTFNVKGGTQAPNNLVVGSPGDLYTRDNGGTGELWQKQTGLGTNTGWVQLSASAVGSVQPALNFTTDGSTDYVFDGTTTSYNPEGRDARGGNVNQFFLDGTYTAPDSWWTWDSVTGTLHIDGDVGGAIVSFSYYL